MRRMSVRYDRCTTGVDRCTMYVCVCCTVGTVYGVRCTVVQVSYGVRFVRRWCLYGTMSVRCTYLRCTSVRYGTVCLYRRTVRTVRPVVRYGVRHDGQAMSTVRRVCHDVCAMYDVRCQVSDVRFTMCRCRCTGACTGDRTMYDDNVRLYDVCTVCTVCTGLRRRRLYGVDDDVRCLYRCTTDVRRCTTTTGRRRRRDVYVGVRLSCRRRRACCTSYGVVVRRRTVGRFVGCCTVRVVDDSYGRVCTVRTVVDVYRRRVYV